MNRLLATLLLASCLPAPAESRAAGEHPAATPEEVGMSSAKLKLVSEKVEELLGKKRLSGASVRVTRKGKLVYNKNFGLRDLENKKRIEADTIFRIYSMSKSITSAAAMMLADEGKLVLDDPIAKHLPSFKEVKVWKHGRTAAPTRTPTVRDYTRFLQMIANGGELQGVRLLKKETVAAMTRNQLSEEAMPIAFGPLKRAGTGFGLGFCVKVANTDWNRAGRIGEYGWGGIASTHYWVSPHDHLVVVTMEQTLPYDFLLENELKPLIYAAIEE